MGHEKGRKGRRGRGVGKGKGMYVCAPEFAEACAAGVAVEGGEELVGGFV
jgi:hypothetical protein